jgi:hypothetical protein
MSEIKTELSGKIPDYIHCSTRKLQTHSTSGVFSHTPIKMPSQYISGLMRPDSIFKGCTYSIPGIP